MNEKKKIFLTNPSLAYKKHCCHLPALPVFLDQGTDVMVKVVYLPHQPTFYQLRYRLRMSDMFSLLSLSLQSTPHFQSVGVQCLCCINIPIRACDLGVTSFLTKQSGKNGSEMADYFRRSGRRRTQAGCRQIASFST